MEKYWGYHLIINGSNCNDNIKDKAMIVAFAKTLVQEIDMVPYGEPEVPYFALHDPDKGGHSLNQFIETSNITGHFVDAHNQMFLDVFSCKDFVSNKVIKCVRQFFGQDMKIDYQLINRTAPKVRLSIDA